MDELYTYILTLGGDVDEMADEWMNPNNYEHNDFFRYAINHGLGYKRYKNDD